METILLSMILRSYNTIHRAYELQTTAPKSRTSENMSHRFGFDCSVPLSTFSANAESGGYQLLARVVQVTDEGKLTLPAYELWCKSEGQQATDSISYLAYRADSLDDDDEEVITFEEANEFLAAGGKPWLRSLDKVSPFGVAGKGEWFVSALLKAERSFWKEQQSASSDSYYVIDQDALREFLNNDRVGLLMRYDDESSWWCLTHSEWDEIEDAPDSVDENEDENEGGVGLLESEWDFVELGLRKMNFTLVECEALGYESGYDGDREMGHA